MMRWMSVLVFAIAALPLAAQPSCQPDAALRAADEVRQRQADLLKVKVEEMSTDVAPAVQAQIAGLQNALAEAVQAGVACAPANEDSSAMQSRLAKLLGANLPEKPFHATPAGTNPSAPVYEDNVYGSDLKVTVSTPTTASALRAIELSYGIECGSDNMLLLYAVTSGRWQPMFAWQSGRYADISKAFGDWLLYSLIPGSDTAGVRVAVAHGTAWCTSNMSAVGMDVLAPVQGHTAPRVVWHKEEGYRRESDPRMIQRPDGFELRVDVSTIELEQIIRKGVFRYRVVGDSVSRVQPIAVDGRGFVDAWLQAPWSDAQRWSVAEGLPTFARVHEQFERSRKDSSVTYSYGPVRSCLMKGRYAVEIDADPGGPMFFGIRTAQDGYVMADYSTTQDERCSGPDLMKKR